ncbi:unnamed protein product [Ectocarpus sp. CCAP 1310/34]|nr:unnamed protein product [Ectocarpus sp. CCAP 1310/34]
MHSTVLPSLPTLSHMASLIAMPTPSTPFLSLVPVRAPLQMTTYPSCAIELCPSRRVS